MSSSAGPLFRVVPCHSELSSSDALLPPLPLPVTRRRHHSASSNPAPPLRQPSAPPSLSIHLTALHPGHIAISFQQGRVFAVFDAVPSSLHLTSTSLSSLHSFLRSPPSPDTPPFPDMLALHTVSSTIIHLQFFTTAPLLPPPSLLPPLPSVPPPPLLRFLIVQADASFLIWQYDPSTSSWSHISRGSLPLTHPSPSRLLRSAHYIEEEESIVWTEEWNEKHYPFVASLPLMQASKMPEVISPQPAIVIPLPSTTPLSLLSTQRGVVLSSSDAHHYWHVATQQLVRIPFPSDSPSPLSVHPITRQLFTITPHGAVFTLDELSPPYSPLLPAPLISWRPHTTLALPNDISLFPLTPPYTLFLFRHTLALLLPTSIHFFTLIAGVPLHSLPLRSPVTPHSTTLSFSGTSTLLSTPTQLFSLVASPLVTQLTQLVSRSPEREMRGEDEGVDGLVQSDTFASPTFSGSFPSLSGLLPSPMSSAPSSPVLQPSLTVAPSTLIPSLPYPSLSHIASLISSSYGSSLSSVRDQHTLNRWIGATTASSSAHLSPSSLPLSLPPPSTMLNEALQSLPSPAIPLSLLVTPSPSHWLHGHIGDGQQTSLVHSELTRWLDCMKPLSTQLQSSDTAPSPSVDSDGSTECSDRFTPLNASLYPLLKSIHSAMSYIHTPPSHSSPSSVAIGLL